MNERVLCVVVSFQWSRARLVRDRVLMHKQEASPHADPGTIVTHILSHPVPAGARLDLHTRVRYWHRLARDECSPPAHAITHPERSVHPCKPHTKYSAHRHFRSLSPSVSLCHGRGTIAHITAREPCRTVDASLHSCGTKASRVIGGVDAHRTVVRSTVALSRHVSVAARRTKRSRAHAPAAGRPRKSRKGRRRKPSWTFGWLFRHQMIYYLAELILHMTE